MFRAIVVLFSGPCCICELPIAGRCILLAPGRGTPRTAGDGTAPALSDPCGIIRDGVKGADPVRPTMAPPTGRPTCDPFPRLKLAGGVIRETTGRIPLRAGGAAARWPAFGPSMALRVGVMPGRPIGAFVSCRADTRTAVPCTDMPFCNVRIGAAVNPPGACRFA